VGKLNDPSDPVVAVVMRVLSACLSFTERPPTPAPLKRVILPLIEVSPGTVTERAGAVFQEGLLELSVMESVGLYVVSDVTA